MYREFQVTKVLRIVDIKSIGYRSSVSRSKSIFNNFTRLSGKSVLDFERNGMVNSPNGQARKSRAERVNVTTRLDKSGRRSRRVRAKPPNPVRVEEFN